MTDYSIAAIAGIPALHVDGMDWHPVRRHFGIEAFGVNAYSARAGQDVIEAHDDGDLGHEELYLVVSGRARFAIGADTHEVGAGSLIHIADPSAWRHGVALEDGTVVLAVGAKPGTAYTVSAWEQAFVDRAAGA
jgi:hypothetical protein